MTTDVINVREMILDTLIEINENQMLSHIATGRMLSKYQFLPKQDRAFYTRIVQGTLENQIRLDYVITQFSKVRIQKMKPLIRELLRMSVYQILYLEHVPDSAACNEAVKLAAKRGFFGLKGFVNGVLRNIVRQKDSLSFPEKDKDMLSYLEVKYSIPKWILEDWNQMYSTEEIEKMGIAFHETRKTSVRIAAPEKRKEILTEFQSLGVTVKENPYCTDGLLLSDYDYLAALPPIAEGLVVVQDTSSMLVGQVAAPKKDDFVIDLCAAPGGKSIHVAQLLQGSGKVLSQDVSDYKVSLIEEAVERTGLSNIECRVFDATDFDAELEEKADLVIADVPCSGLGVLGRKPEIRYRMSREQIRELNALQKRIVTNAMRYVKPGGTLIYSTCTINRIENQDMVQWIRKNSDLESVSLDSYLPDALCGKTTKEGYLQLLPGIHESDGFFLARFEKSNQSLRNED